jgi:tetratricopeptide (TPR) repeat protein
MDGESCIRKAYDYILHGDFESAIHWFELAIKAEPDNAGYYHKCAVSCARSNKWTKAKHYSDTAIALEPDNSEYIYYSELIRSKLLLEEVGVLLASVPPRLLEAGDKLAEVISLDPLSFDGFYTLAMVRYTEGDYEHAGKLVKEALKLDPQHAAARRLYADTRRKIRKNSKG